MPEVCCKKRSGKKASFIMDEAAEAVYNAFSKSMVHVFMKTTGSDKITATGTGFIVSTVGHQCLVVTCRHCIVEDGEFDPAIHKLAIRLSGDARNDFEARKVFSDMDRDIAVIRFETVDAPPPPMTFAEDDNELPSVEKHIVVALGFCSPDKDEDESEDDNEDESEDDNEDESENEDGTFAYLEEVAALPGRIIMQQLEIDGEGFKEVYDADCGLINGCSGGPLVYKSKVVGVATRVDVQVERYVTPKTVKAVFQGWLGLAPDDGRTIKQLIEDISERPDALD
ncbi:hypothetical protein EJB05_32757, partial [Eragrostis curvula]